jgi:hypothetical protein
MPATCWTLLGVPTTAAWVALLMRSSSYICIVEVLDYSRLSGWLWRELVDAENEWPFTGYWLGKLERLIRTRLCIIREIPRNGHHILYLGSSLHDRILNDLELAVHHMHFCFSASLSSHETDTDIITIAALQFPKTHETGCSFGVVMLIWV